MHNLDKQLKYFVGIDWGSQNHRVVVLNHEKRVIERYDAAHSGKGLENLVDLIRKKCPGPAIQTGIALEVSWGALVETLAEAGFSVFSINPKQSDRFRDRHTAAGAKDDSRDALVLASALTTDPKSFRRVQVDDPSTIRLRELSRLDEELKNDLHRAANQLWEQLHRYFPQMLKLSSGADDPFVWKLLSEAPMPAKAGKLKVSRITQILKSHRIRRFTAAQVVTILREPSLQPAPGAAEAASEHVLLLLPHLALLDEQIKDVARRTAKPLKDLPQNPDPNGNAREHRDIDLLLSLPGLGQTIASTILAEASRPIRERDYEALRCYAGTAPVTKQSSKRRMVSMRHACSERIRQTVFHWSSRSVMLDSRSRQHYDKLRAAGHGHARALRGVGDRLLAVLTAILQSGKLFDASLRGTFPT